MKIIYTHITTHYISFLKSSQSYIIKSSRDKSLNILLNLNTSYKIYNSKFDLKNNKIKEQSLY